MKLELQKGSRTKLLAAIVLGLMAVFIARLFYLQIIQHDKYVAEAAQEQTRRLTIPAKRGEIYVMDGDSPVKMVMNQTVYTLFADPAVVTDTSHALDVIRKVAGGNMVEHADTLIKKKDSRYAILATKLTRTQAESIKKESLSGIGFQETTQRVYPEGSLGSQIIGFVNGEGIGQYGVEGALNTQLTGTDGELQSVADVNNVPLTIGSNNINKAAKNGENVVLTIDRNVQAYAEQALAAGLQQSKASNGSVLVMDPQTGKILAMANQPTYDPSKYNEVTDASAFNNATITAPYEPGSDVKTLTMATGVDVGAVKPTDTYNNTDSIKVDDTTITNATKGQTGNITFQHALNYSLNTGFVTVAERLGDGKSINRSARNTMYSYFHDKLGLGELTGVELAGEAQGTVISPEDEQGNAVRYSNMAFGQGLDVTMVQMGAAFSTIINGGTYYTPTVVAGTQSDDGDTFTPATAKASKTNVVKASTAATMRQMIHDARSAFYAKKDKKGYYIGGKTGTSQTIENGHYVDNQTVGTYLGFGGDSADTPRYVIMVQVSGKGMNLSGSTDALPIFTDISNWMIDYLKLQPQG